MALDRKTVLILGAGASVPYNYPTGRELQYCLTTPSEELHRVLRDLGHSETAVQEVSKSLRRFKANSIDEFLARYQEHSTIAKQAIAYEILRRENIDTQLAVCADDWYSYLVLGVLEDDPHLKDGLLKIVTFNYDLSIDAHIHELLTARHRLTDQEAAERLKSLELIHVYGQVGPVKGIHGTGRMFGRGPGQAPSVSEVEAAASQIMSIADPTSAALWERAQKTIAVAEDVVFIGFGWGIDNVRRLNLREVAKGATRIAATTVGFTDLKPIQDQLPVGPQFTNAITANRPAPTTDMIERMFQTLWQSS